MCLYLIYISWFHSEIASRNPSPLVKTILPGWLVGWDLVLPYCINYYLFVKPRRHLMEWLQNPFHIAHVVILLRNEVYTVDKLDRRKGLKRLPLPHPIDTRAGQPGSPFPFPADNGARLLVVSHARFPHRHDAFPWL